MSEKLQHAKEGALWGMLIADALAMPVHWYYNPQDIKRGYGGWLTGYVPPNKKHPSSILTLSATDGSGRTGWHAKSNQVVGHIILHDKLKYWTSGDRTIHYHQGMSAGDSTLNSLLALQALQTMNRVDPECTLPDREVRGHVLEDYVKFMTTPGSHNDTYAESSHRLFFRDWSLEKTKFTNAEELLTFTEARYKEKIKGRPDSQLSSIGALAGAIPWVLRNAHKSEDECARGAIDFIKCTHPVSSLVPFVDMYARLLHTVLNGRDLKQSVTSVLAHSELGGPSKRQMVYQLVDNVMKKSDPESQLEALQAGTQTLGSACYIEGALSSMLLLAYVYADQPNNFKQALLMNANCGGENCHRGAALGALLGASTVSSGASIPEDLIQGLQQRNKVTQMLQANL